MNRKTLEEFLCEISPMLKVGDKYFTTHLLSGLPVCTGDLIYAGQFMSLYGRIQERQFELHNILFSPKELDLLETRFVFFYNDVLGGVPVFIPIKQEGRDIHQSRMIRVLSTVFDPIIEAITQKRREYLSANFPFEHSLN